MPNLVNQALPVFAPAAQKNPHTVLLFLQAGTLISGFYAVLYYADSAQGLTACALMGIATGAICAQWAQRYFNW